MAGEFDPAGMRCRPDTNGGRQMKTLRFLAAASLVAAAVAGSQPALGSVRPHSPQAVSTPVDVTADQYADNETSMGMSADGQLAAGAWNDWDYNDGCGFSYSIDGGDTWAPRTFVPNFTEFTND